MARIAINLNGNLVVYKVKAAEMTSIIDHYRDVYTTAQDEEDGITPLSDAIVVERFAAGIVKGLTANAVRRQKDVAAKVAADAVAEFEAEIDLT